MHLNILYLVLMIALYSQMFKRVTAYREQYLLHFRICAPVYSPQELFFAVESFSIHRRHIQCVKICLDGFVQEHVVAGWKGEEGRTQIFSLQ